MQAVIGDALTDGYTSQIAPSEALVHLVGVSHPSPAKAEQFRSIDLKSVYAAVSAAKTSGVKHFVYVSVAHPSPMMKAYIAVRQECEQIIGESGLNATFIRPWYGARTSVALRAAAHVLAGRALSRHARISTATGIGHAATNAECFGERSGKPSGGPTNHDGSRHPQGAACSIRQSLNRLRVPICRLPGAAVVPN